MKALEIPGKVDEFGKLEIDRKLLADVIKSLTGKEIVISISKRTKRRSNPQNAYLWGVVYPLLLDGLIGVGYDISKGDTELIHEWSKKEFLQPIKIERENGDSLTVPASTAKLTTVEFMEYVDRITQFAAEFLGTVIPPPNTEGWFPDEPHR